MACYILVTYAGQISDVRKNSVQCIGVSGNSLVLILLQVELVQFVGIEF